MQPDQNNANLQPLPPSGPGPAPVDAAPVVPSAPADSQFVPPTNAATIGSGSPAATANSTTGTTEKARRAPSTQNSLLISEIREGMVIMSDGSFRAVVACKSINFDLMSAREREGVEFSYQNFLNALYFPIQIFIRSQRIDIEPYLDKLEDIRKTQDNMLLNVLMDDYISFIDILSQEANIMDKSFFVIVPYFPNVGDLGAVVGQSKSLFDKLLGVAKPKVQTTKIDKATYDKAKDELRSRVDSVVNSLMQVGIQSVQLDTKQLGELYYNIYNPDTAVREPLVNFESITSTYVRKATPEQSPAPQNQGAIA